MNCLFTVLWITFASIIMKTALSGVMVVALLCTGGECLTGAVTQSLGCYQDTAQRVWLNGLNKLAGNTPHLCVHLCAGFQYAGLQAGVQCFCGDTLPPVRLPQSKCNRPCEGDRRITCGGHFAMEVYPVPQIRPTDLHPGTHLGCYADNPDRVWKTGLHRLTMNSPQLCKNLCAGHNYYALQGRVWCQCGHNVPPMMYGQSACRSKCPGNLEATCGGNWTMDVYDVNPNAVKPTQTQLVETSDTSQVGCYEDVKDRVWKNGMNVIRNNNSPQLCKKICKGYIYAGLEAGIQCFCGNTLPPTSLPRSMCNKVCDGDKRTTCGGHWALEVYGVTGGSVQANNEDLHLGCYEDTTERVWKNGLNRLDKNSPQFCKNLCAGHKFYGLEAGSWCLCGDSLPPRKLSPEECNSNCPGQRGKKCGGTSALDVYEAGTADQGSSKLTPVGCFEENKEHVWHNGINNLIDNTPELCRAVCKGFKYAGVLRGVLCMCGDTLPLLRLPQPSCNRACAGDSTRTCGGGLGLDVFELATNTPNGNPVSGVGTHLGCFVDTKERVWKNGINRLDRNSPQLCKSLCTGFKYYGLEAGFWCLCGDTVPPQKASAAGCGVNCPGQPGKKCGGAWGLEVYQIDGVGTPSQPPSKPPGNGCGTIRRRPNAGGVQLTAGGSASELGDSPWHSGIYRVATNSYTQICGGTLITPQHILSAAHCFWDIPLKSPRPTADYKVALGKHHRGWQYDDEGVQRRDIEHVNVHELYAAFEKFLAYDIAMVKLSKAVTITWSVNIVCLDWDHSLEAMQLSANNLGTVSGWEITAPMNTDTDVLKTVQLPYVPYDKCSILVEDKFRPFLTHDKICAGYINRSISVCGGDSGSGYVFPHVVGQIDVRGHTVTHHREDAIYYMRGVVSVGQLPSEHSLSVCNDQQLAGFTSLSTFMPWIAEKMKL